MRAPICSVLSLLIPVVVGAAGLYWVRGAKGATNLGEAMAPLLAMALVLTLAAVAGEIAAVASLLRGERLRWLGWLGVAVNAVLLAPAVFFAATADWS